MKRHTKTTNKIGISSARTGSARAMGVILGIAALLGAGAAGYAIYTLAQPTPPGPSAAGDEPVETGIAPTATIEGVLASVQSFVRDEEYGRAQTVLDAAVVQYPSDQDLRAAYADLLMLAGDRAGAYDQFVAAIEIGPSSAAMEFSAGTLANTLGKPELAEAHYTNALRMDPSRAEYPMYLAVVQMNQNRLKEAKANLALAAQLAPDDAMVWGIWATIALRENKGEIALQMVEKSRGLQPRVARWIVLEAKIRKRRGEVEQAINLLTGLPEEDLRSLATLELLAECFGMVGRPGDAASRYLDAAEADPQNAELAFETAVWLERAGERESAVKWGRRARDLGHQRAGDWLGSLP